MRASDILVNGKFTRSQLELLKLFATEPTDEELNELHQFFVKYLAEKALDIVDESIAEKGYSKSEIDAWSKLHERTTYQSYKKFLAEKSKSSDR